MSFIKSNKVYIIVFIITTILFHLIFSLQIIYPENINWLMSARHDWGQHYLGWEFYRNEPWTFPLGTIDAICYPSGTNVGYMDSIPLLAIFFKIVSFALPENFQYLGAWLFFCFILTAYYTVKLLKLYSIQTVYIVLAAILITFNPVLVYRTMHPALCAHWLILACLYLYLKPATAQNVFRINKRLLFLVALSALISPYLCFFISGFGVIIPFRHYYYDKLISFRSVIIYPCISALLVFLLWVIMGMITLNGTTSLAVSGGYGVLSFNLNSLYNSWGVSRFIPSFPRVTDHQYEGFLYLGVGIMMLSIIAVICFFVYKKPKEFIKQHKDLLPLFMLALLLSVFAVTHKITFNDKILLEIPTPEIVKKLGNVFRASGRAVWIMFYMCLLFCTIIFLKSSIHRVVKVALLVVILAIQAYDLEGFYFRRNFPPGNYDTPLDETAWNKRLTPFDRIITYPPYNNHLLNQMDYQDLCYIALKNNKAISTGYTARENDTAYKIFTDSLTDNLNKGILDTKEIYITTPKDLQAFDVVLHTKKAVLDYLDGYYIIYSKERENDVPKSEDPVALKLADSVNKAYSSNNILKNINKFTFTNDKITVNIESFSRHKNNIKISGRAILKQEPNLKDSVFITVSNNSNMFIIRTERSVKEGTVNTSTDMDHNTGFSTSFFTESISNIKGYDLGIAIKSSSGELIHYKISKIGEMDQEGEPKKLFALPKTDEQNLIGSVDMADVKHGMIMVNGWAALKNQHSDNVKLEVAFISEGHVFYVTPKNVLRPDVTQAFKTKYSYDASGFNVIFKTQKLPKGNYTLGIIAKDITTGEKVFRLFDKKINVE